MNTIVGKMYRSDGVENTTKTGYINWEIVSKSIKNNTWTINVSLYIGNQSGTTIPSSSNQAFNIKYDGANTYSGTQSWSNTTVGTDILLGTTTYTISATSSGKTKNVTLYGYGNVIPGSFFDHIEVSGTATLPKISNGNKKISDTWKQGFFWTRISGTWKRCVIWRKISGTWKKGV